jgi:dienelactone hydrolase
VGLLSLIAAAVALIAVLDAPGRPRSRDSARPARSTAQRPHVGSTVRVTRAASSFAVGLRVLSLVDPSRMITLPDGSSRPRSLLTYVRYPALGDTRGTDLANAPPARAGGPFPLIVFGHGFAVTPAPYSRLLQSWARAGYVVAAPVFPLENEDAPGGPQESDLTHQPADMSFVVSSLLADSAGAGPLSGLLRAGRIAAAGQSDGGDTALALAYDPRFRDRRVGAAVILSGAEMPGVSGFTFPVGSPPLLATQGNADTINPPSLTREFFQAARRPKYALSLQGAEHLAPYTSGEPQLAIVERVTIAFLDGYLKGNSAALRSLTSLGDVAGTSSLLAQP